MLKHTLISYLILTIVMLYFANKILDSKDRLVEKVLGTYTREFEEINKATGMDVYNIDNTTSYQEMLKEIEGLQ